MWKKIILTIVAVLFAGGALMMYGTYKAVDDTLKQKEPQLRQYVQMDETAQNKYILDNVTELLAGIDLNKDGKPEDKEQMELFKKANTNNPEIQQALADVGRSFMAATVLLSESITKDMSADVKAKYEKESGEFETRLDKYTKLLEAVGIKIEKD
ncbi:MAG: hypothetical protein IJQ85_02300 [Selenomonadaceae bacterium]|nr:hypothetical protein [Selenomonadaceae bacterium]